jgi:hypothetical protein
MPHLCRHTHTMHTLNTHRVYTLHTRTPLTPFKHTSCKHACRTYTACILFAHCMHAVSMPHVITLHGCCMHTACALNACHTNVHIPNAFRITHHTRRCMHATLTLHTLCMHTLNRLYMSHTPALCTLHIRRTLATCIPYGGCTLSACAHSCMCRDTATSLLHIHCMHTLHSYMMYAHPTGATLERYIFTLTLHQHMSFPPE